MTTTTTIDYGITISEVHLPAGAPLRASCLCGWVSPVVPSRLDARKAGDIHVANVHAKLRRQPLVECAPWCVDQDGHPGCVFVEDQWCGTSMLTIELSLERQLPAQPGHFEPDSLNVYALRAPGEPVRFDVEHVGGSCIALTVAEAHQLVEAFQLLFGQIEAAR